MPQIRHKFSKNLSWIYLSPTSQEFKCLSKNLDSSMLLRFLNETKLLKAQNPEVIVNTNPSYQHLKK